MSAAKNGPHDHARGCRAPEKGACVIALRVVRELTDEEQMFEQAARQAPWSFGEPVLD